MFLNQAMAQAEKESRESECTVYLCAAFIWHHREGTDPDGQRKAQVEATVDKCGYTVSDWFDGSSIGRCTNGEWRDLP